MADESLATTAGAGTATAETPSAPVNSSGDGATTADVAKAEGQVTQPTETAGTDGAPATAAKPTINPAHALIGKQLGFTDEELSAMPETALSKLLDRQAQEAESTVQLYEEWEKTQAEQAKVQPSPTPTPAQTTPAPTPDVEDLDVSDITPEGGFEPELVGFASTTAAIVNSQRKQIADLTARLDKIDNQWAEDVAPAAESYREQKRQALEKEVNTFYDTELKDFSEIIGVTGTETPEQKKVRTELEKTAGVFQAVQRQQGLKCSPQQALLAAFTTKYLKDIKARIAIAVVTEQKKQAAAASPHPTGTKAVAAAVEPRKAAIAKLDAFKDKRKDQSR